MNILYIVTYLYNRGGDSNHAFALADALASKGHNVSFFGMEDPNNFPNLPGPFAPRVDYQELKSKKGIKSALLALNSIYSLNARRAAETFIEQHGPFDIAHIHSVHHQLTLSVLDALRKAKLPIIWTLHDYKLICPNTTLFNDSTGIRCDSLGQEAPFCVAKNKCKKASTSASYLAAIESWYNLKRQFYNLPECFVSPSNFLKDLVLKNKVTNRPVVHIPNFTTHSPDNTPEPVGSDFLFIGRLSNGKGVDVLIHAFSNVYDQLPGKLMIVGSGPVEQDLKLLAKRLLPPDRYEFTGHVTSKDAVQGYFHRARCAVLPAIWYENMPLSILEAFSHARPVIASDIGGIPEMVQDGQNGCLFPTGSVDVLAAKLVLYGKDSGLATAHGINGWNSVKESFTLDSYLKKISDVYQKAISGYFAER